MNELISVIIPVYNSEKTISKCLKSILNQTYKNLEIIIVNDGSKDNTENIVKNIAREDKRIKLIKQQNAGVSSARNNGIKNSKGKYILFVDCDDWLEINMIEELYYYINEKEVDVVRCNFFDDKIHNSAIGKLYELSDKKVLSKDFKKENIYNHFLLANEPIKNLVMLLLVKKEIFLKGLTFNTKLYMMEDVVFYQDLFEKIDSIYFLDKPLYHYCENIESATNNYNKYEKNIYGILDTNIMLREKITNEICDVNSLNANHLRIISYYLESIYYNTDSKNLIFVLKRLFLTDKFKFIMKNINYSGFSLYLKFVINAIKTHNYLFLMILFKIKKRRIQ